MFCHIGLASGIMHVFYVLCYYSPLLIAHHTVGFTAMHFLYLPWSFGFQFILVQLPRASESCNHVCFYFWQLCRCCMDMPLMCRLVDSLWSEVKQTWNFLPERAKHCFSAWCSVTLSPYPRCLTAMHRYCRKGEFWRLGWGKRSWCDQDASWGKSWLWCICV